MRFLAPLLLRSQPTGVNAVNLLSQFDRWTSAKTKFDALCFSHVSLIVRWIQNVHSPRHIFHSIANSHDYEGIVVSVGRIFE